MKAKPIVPRSEANRDVDEAIDVWRVLHGNVTFQHGWLTTLTQTICSNVGQIKRVAWPLVALQFPAERPLQRRIRRQRCYSHRQTLIAMHPTPK
jgi:hypothetical protein